MFFVIFFAISQAIKLLEDDSDKSTMSSDPISVPIDQMKSNHPNDCTTDLDCSDFGNVGVKCGKRCKANNTNHYFEYEFEGRQFQIYGTKKQGYGEITIYLDEKMHGTVNTDSGSEELNTLLYTSDILDYGKHTIKVQGTSTYEIYKFAYWPCVQPRRYDFDDFSSSGTWLKKTDNIGYYYVWTNNGDAKISIDVPTTRIWVYGSTYPGYGSLKITFNGQTTVVSEDGVEKQGVLLYRSDELPFKTYSLTIENANLPDKKQVTFYCVQFHYDPPIQTQEPLPSRSSVPSTSDFYINKVFVGQVEGRPSLGQDSLIRQVSGCRFYNMSIGNFNFFLGEMDPDVVVFDNIFENAEGIRNKAISYLNRGGSMTISSCTFSGFRFTSGNIIEGTIMSFNYGISLTYDTCIFKNNGQDDTQVMLKINGEAGSTAKFLKCTFTLDDANRGCKIANFKIKELLFDQCTFIRPPKEMINIDKPGNVNSIFTFTNCKVQGAINNFIKASNMVTKPVINNNTFESIDLQGSSLIKYVSNVNQIDLIGNTFSHISNSGGQYCGGSGLWFQNSAKGRTSYSIRECKFYDLVNNNNKEPFNQGGAFQCGYSSSIALATFNFEKCEFKRNTCSSGYGGAIAMNIDGDITINECIFEDNHAGEVGGAIYIWAKIVKPDNNNEAPDVPVNFPVQAYTITNCQFIRNKADDGHAIYIHPEKVSAVKLEVTSSNFVNNGERIATYMIVNNCGEFVFESNTVEYKDATVTTAAINLGEQTSTVSITGSNFLNCITTNQASVNIASTNDSSSSTISNCQFTNCKAGNYVVVNQKGIINVDQCTISFDDSTNACGGFSFGNKSFSLKNSNFLRTNANGAIKFEQASDVTESVTIQNCVFDACSGEANKACDLILFTTSFTFTGNTFQNLVESGNSGYFIHIVFNNEVPSLELSNIQWINNRCNSNYGGGSGLWITQVKNIIFKDCTFTNNIALRSPDARPGFTTFAGEGGAIQFGLHADTKNVNLEFSNCHFNKNKAYGHGGSLAIQTLGTVQINDCSFNGNAANYKSSSSRLLDDVEKEGRGGAMYFSPGTSTSDATLNIERSTFESNTAFDAYAIYIEGNSTTVHYNLDGNNFTNNFDKEHIVYKKSVILTEDQALSLDTVKEHNIFDHDKAPSKPADFNYADANGVSLGEIPEDAPMEFEVINVTTHGRHEYIVEDEGSTVVNVMITSFNRIKSSKDGGALHIENAGLSCEDVNFTECTTSSGSGGAMYIKNTRESVNYVNVLRNIITGCSATECGGGIYIYSSNKNNNVIVKGCTFEANTVDNAKGGSGLYVAARKGQVKANIFIDNNAAGSAFKVTNSFDDEPQGSLRILSANEKLVISDCHFIITNHADAGFHYDRGVGGTLVEMKDCTFSGKLAKNGHFITGETISKNSPKLIVKGCKFASDVSNAVTLDSDYLSIDLKNQVFDSLNAKDESKQLSKQKKNPLIVIVATASVALIAIIGFVIFAVRKKSDSLLNEDEMSSDANDI